MQPMLRKMLLSLILVTVFVTPVWATTYFVSKSGDDNHGGTGTWDNAWASLDAVNAGVSGGDTVFFATGVYRGRLDPVSGLSASAPTVYACSAFTEGIASIWASDSVTGWTNHMGHVYKAHYEVQVLWEGWQGLHVVGQLDATYDTMLQYQSSMPDAPGEFYYSNNTVYVWLVGNGDPSADSITIECSSQPCVAFYAQDHVKIWGFKMRYGKHACVRFAAGGKADSNFIEHCHLSRTGGETASNTALIGSGSFGSPDSQYQRWGNEVRACWLAGQVFDMLGEASIHRFGLCYFGQWDIVIESCYVSGSYTAGFNIKANSGYGNVRHNYFEAQGNCGAAIKYVAGYKYHNIYGNIIVGNNSMGKGIELRGAFDNPIDNDMLVSNNTIINVTYNAILSPSWNVNQYHMGNNRFKYNIIYLVPEANNSWSGGICKIIWNDSLYWTLDSNMYYVQTGDTTFQAVGSGNHFNLGSWRSRFGFDINSFVGVYPNFDNVNNGDYHRSNAPVEMDYTYPDGWRATIYGALQNNYPQGYLSQDLTVVAVDTAAMEIRNFYISIGVTVDNTEYQWSLDNFSSFAGKDTVVSPPNPDTVQIEGLMPDMLYFIRAISRDASQGIVDTSSTLEVRTLEFPMIPMPDTLGTRLEDDRVEAYASTVDAGTPVYYEFELDTLTDFLTARLDIGASAANSDTVTGTFDGLLSGIEYCWRVRAVASLDTSFYSNWSPAVIFSTGAVPVGEKCFGITPSEGATIDTLIPTFVASCENAGNYIYFQVDDNLGFDSPIESGPVAIAANNTASWQISEPLSNEKVYFWRAGTDNLEWFSPISFRVGMDIFAYPVPFRPQDGHSNITFTNLPEQSRITIVSVSGSVVKTSEILKGGDWVWDVRSNGNDTNDYLASGVYLYAIEFPAGTSRGKLMVIR